VPVSLEADFAGVRWSKLLINASFSGKSAVLGCTFGEAAKDRRSRAYVQRIIKERIDAARAEGVRITPAQGKDIVKLLDYHGPVKRAISSFIIPIAINGAMAEPQVRRTDALQQTRREHPPWHRAGTLRAGVGEHRTV